MDIGFRVSRVALSETARVDSSSIIAADGCLASGFERSAWLPDVIGRSVYRRGTIA